MSRRLRTCDSDTATHALWAQSTRRLENRLVCRVSDLLAHVLRQLVELRTHGGDLREYFGRLADRVVEGAVAQGEELLLDVAQIAAHLEFFGVVHQWLGWCCDAVYNDTE